MSLKDTCVSAWENLPVTIEAGAALTGPLNLGGLRLFGIIVPAAWTPANLTFQMSPDAGSTWVNMVDQNGNEIVSVGEPNAYIAINNASHFAPLQYLQIRSGSAAVPVVQTAQRTLQLVLRGV